VAGMERKESATAAIAAAADRYTALMTQRPN
jgi:hypothetical protein